MVSLEGRWPTVGTEKIYFGLNRRIGEFLFITSSRLRLYASWPCVTEKPCRWPFHEGTCAPGRTETSAAPRSVERPIADRLAAGRMARPPAAQRSDSDRARKLARRSAKLGRAPTGTPGAPAPPPLPARTAHRRETRRHRRGHSQTPGADRRR